MYKQTHPLLVAMRQGCTNRRTMAQQKAVQRKNRNFITHRSKLRCSHASSTTQRDTDRTSNNGKRGNGDIPDWDRLGIHGALLACSTATPSPHAPLLHAASPPSSVVGSTSTEKGIGDKRMNPRERKRLRPIWSGATMHATGTGLC